LYCPSQLHRPHGCNTIAQYSTPFRPPVFTPYTHTIFNIVHGNILYRLSHDAEDRCMWFVRWPLQEIHLLVLGLCPRISTIMSKYPPCVDTPPPCIADTIARNIVFFPDQPVLQCMPYNIGNGNIYHVKANLFNLQSVLRSARRVAYAACSPRAPTHLHAVVIRGGAVLESPRGGAIRAASEGR